MTVANHIPTIKHYTGDGILSQFDIPFEFLDKDHLDVYLDDVLQDPAVYTVINCQERAGDNGCLEGADLVFTTTPATGVKIAIIRCTPATNESDWRPNLKFQAEVKERALDKLTMILQEIHDRAGLIAKVAGEGPQCYGDENGRACHNLIDARVALLWKKNPLDATEYEFVYVCFDELKADCYACKDRGVWKYAHEFNGCSTLPTIIDDFAPTFADPDFSKKTYVMMYTLKDASGNTYFRFNAPQACSDRSTCGGGDVNLLVQWNKWVKCSDGSHFGWLNNDNAQKFYYDPIRDECIKEKSPVEFESGTLGDYRPLITTENLTAIDDCNANKCFPCNECTCTADANVTFEYSVCDETENNTRLNSSCLDINKSPTGTIGPNTVLYEPSGAGHCFYNVTGSATLPGVGQWKISIKCVGDMWQIRIAGEGGLAGSCTSNLSSDGWQNAPTLRCIGGRPQGTVTNVKMSEQSDLDGKAWECGYSTLVFS